MDDKSTTDDTGSAADKTDDFDLSAEDHVGNDQGSATDDKAVIEDDKDATSTKTDDKADKADPDAKKDSPAFDDDIDEWAEKTGHDKPENDRERKLMQDLRNSKREFVSKRQAQKTAQDLQKTIQEATPAAKEDDATVDPLELEVKSLRGDLNQERTTRLQSEYFSENGVSQDEVDVMGEILKEKAERKDMKAFDYLSDARNIADLHDLAKIRMSKTSTDSSDLVEKAKQEERERLAKLSKSGTTTRSAQGRTSPAKKDEVAAIWDDDSV